MIRWLKRMFGAPAAAPSPAPASETPKIAPEPSPPALPPEIERLRTIDSTTDPGVALHALHALEGGPHERAALAEVVRLAREGLSSPDLTRRAAEIALRRGDEEEALGLLADATTAGSLALRSEVLAGRGSLVSAIESLEQALALDITLPGARDRLSRWRAAIGHPRAAAATSPDATLLTSAPADVPFRILADAGRGGTASVYQAEDERLGRHVALKVYHRADGSRDQLAREARVAAHVAGRGVVRVFDASFDGGWVALEWAPEGSLRDALRAKNAALVLPVTRWLPAVIAALARVHERGWVHGDVKPGNVLLHRRGALLTDFGLARRRGEAWTGGTVGYLSPARLAGSPAAPADDLFALGRMLDDVRDDLGVDDPLLEAVASLCLSSLDRETASAADLVGREGLDESSS